MVWHDIRILVDVAGLVTCIVAVWYCLRNASLHRYISGFLILASAALGAICRQLFLRPLSRYDVVVRIIDVCLVLFGFGVVLKRWSSAKKEYNRMT